jgi:hypothetical protein
VFSFHLEIRPAAGEISSYRVPARFACLTGRNSRVKAGTGWKRLTAEEAEKNVGSDCMMAGTGRLFSKLKALTLP